MSDLLTLTLLHVSKDFTLLFHAKGMWASARQILKSLNSRYRHASLQDAPENAQNRHGSTQDTAVHAVDRDTS